MTQKNTDMICQTNALTNARYNFTAMEKNVLYVIIKKIRENYAEGTMSDANSEWQNFYVYLNSSDFARIADENHTARAKETLVKLRSKTIEIEDKEGNWLCIGFINYAKYLAKRKQYIVEISEEIMPHLVELTRCFTAYSLTVVISLKSKYSQRFYELACQFRTAKSFFVNHLDLEKMLKMENVYPRISDFRRNVIEVAINELLTAYESNRSDLWLEYYQEGRGKESRYMFYIHERHQEEKEQENIQNIRKLQIEIYNHCKLVFAKDQKFCERINQYLDMNPDEISTLHSKLCKLNQKYKGSDLAKLERYVLREDFTII
jgi:plasmid replication initiation protein